MAVQLLNVVPMKNNAPYVANETMIIKNLVDAINGLDTMKLPLTSKGKEK